jgi:predicted outer membrane repeat protein
MFNYAYHDGYSSPTLTNVTFAGNWASDGGGAMFNDGHFGGESNPTLTNVIFRNNSAGHGWTSDHGGAMFNNGDQGTSNPMLVNVVFSGNSADGDGGALYCTGMHGRCNPTLINVTFSDNSAGDDGGAIAHGGYPDPNNANLTLSNVILWGSTADDSGDQMMVAYAILTIGHSDVQGGLLGSGVYYVESTLVDLGGNINITPRFVGAAVGNLRLFDTSPCIDAGNNDAVPSGITTDLDGNPRFVDFPPPGGTGSGTPPLVDMGAYEEPLEGYHEYRVYLPLVLKQ